MMSRGHMLAQVLFALWMGVIFTYFAMSAAGESFGPAFRAGLLCTAGLGAAHTVMALAGRQRRDES